MVSKAQLKATAKYQKKAYDKVTIYLPKGTRERMTAVSGLTASSYAKAAVLDKLAADEAAKEFDQQMQDFMPQPEAEEDFPFN